MCIKAKIKKNVSYIKQTKYCVTRILIYFQKKTKCYVITPVSYLYNKISISINVSKMGYLWVLKLKKENNMY